MEDATEVVVVGGGATGVGTARDLAMRGVAVTLVDRGGLAAGTSGRSHGLLHSGARYAESDPVGVTECLEESRTLREIGGHCVRDTGGLFVQLAGDDPAYFDEKRDACLDAGMDVEVRDGDAAREAVPRLSDNVERVMAVPDGVVFPSRLVAANAASAQEHGAEIRTHAPVTDVHVDGGRVTGVSVGGEIDGTIETDYLVNATGTWAAECAALAGVTVEMRPTKGAMVAVNYDGLETVLNRCRPPADGDIVIPHGRQVVLGTTSVPVDDPDDFPRESREIRAVIDECAAMLPDLPTRDIARSYWGVRPLYEPDEAARGDTRGISRGFFLLDHADEGAAGFASIAGGKLTTYRLMAEAVADHVCERLGVDAPCRTAAEPLPGGSSPRRLDRYATAFDARSPADVDVLSTTRWEGNGGRRRR